MIDAPSSRVVLVALLVLGASVAATGAATAQSQVTLTVTVVDQDGNTVSGVGLSATWNGGDGGPVTETTRANGQALIDVPEGAAVEIAVDDDQYVRNVPLTVADASSREVEVQVARSATATVSVVDTGGSPLGGARVRLFREGTYVTNQRTGGDGTVATPPVEQGEYLVVANKPGFYRNLTRTQVTGSTEKTVVLREGSVLVTFSVVDDHFNDSRPMRNATIKVGSVGSVQTLSDGGATISIPVNTDHTVTVSKPGYQTVERQLSVAETRQTTNVSISRTPRLDIEPANRRVVVDESVRLTVTDEYDEPVANATVSRDGEAIGRTDASGTIVAGVPSAGNVTFVAQNGSLSANVTVQGVQPGEVETTRADTESPTSEETTTTTGLAGPGFTPLVTAFALVVAAALLAWRRR